MFSFSRFSTALFCAAGVFAVTASAGDLSHTSKAELRRMASQGDGAAYYELAKRAERNFDMNDYSRDLASSVELNYPPAVLESTKRLIEGRYMKKNASMAYKLLEELVRRNPDSVYTDELLLRASDYLGQCFEFGQGVRPDHPRALKNYFFGSIGNRNARVALARYLVRGTAGIKDPELAGILFYLEDAAGGDKTVLSVYEQCELPIADRLARFEKMFSGGNPRAAFLLGEAYLFGKGAKISREKAIQYYTRSADMGCVDAIKTLASFYASGEYVARDPAKSLQYFQRVEELTGALDAETSALVADLFMETNQPDRAFPYFIAARKFVEAQKILSGRKDNTVSGDEIYFNAKKFAVKADVSGGVEKSDSYKDMLRMAANAGSLPALREYVAVSKDYSRLIAICAPNGTMNPAFTKDPRFLVMAGNLFLTGRGTADRKPDLKQAAKFYEMAAKLDSPSALANLAIIYSKKDNPFYNDKKAMEIRRSLALKYIFSSARPEYYKKYFEFLLDGRAAPQEYKTAVSVLQAAVENPDACYYLARLSALPQSGLIYSDFNTIFLYNLAVKGNYKADAVQRISDFFRSESKNFQPDSELAERYLHLL